MSRFKNIWTPRSLVVVFFEFDGSGVQLFAGKFSSKSDTPVETQRFDDLEAIVKHFGSSKPYHFHCSGSGILSRLVDSSATLRQDVIINGDPEDFLFSEFDDGQKTAVSFCRMSLLQEHIDWMKEKNAHLYGLSCGPTPILTVLEDERAVLDWDLQVNENRIEKFERSQDPKKAALWRSDRWSPQSLVGLSVAKLLRNPVEAYSSTETELLADRQENYKQYNQFRTVGLTAVGVIFLALTVNYFYQNHLNQQIAERELDLSSHNERLSMLERLKQEKTRKEQLISSAGVNAPNFLAFYLDEIGKSVPKPVTLSDMTVFPIIGKMKNKRKVEVDKTQVRIGGITKGNEILDDWMEKMDRFDWVKSVELLNYLKSDDQWAEFELVITLET